MQKSYSYGEMMEMQQDAIRRVIEMQRRAEEKLGRGIPPQQTAPTVTQEAPPQTGTPQAPGSAARQGGKSDAAQKNRQQAERPRSQETARQEQESNPMQQENHQQSSNSRNPAFFLPERRTKGFDLGNLLKGLNLESDQMIIGALILFLLSQGADITLILALGYIML